MHSFDMDVAMKVGVNAAIIYQNITWWCSKNAANERNVRDGKVWTYNSIRAFHTLFPYLTEKQIRSALDKLEESSLIETGNFNDDPRDRTKWYAIVGASNCPDGQSALPSRAETFAPQGEPLPDSKPDSKPDTTHAGAREGLFDSLPEKKDTPLSVLSEVVDKRAAKDIIKYRKERKKGRKNMALTVQGAKLMRTALERIPEVHRQIAIDTMILKNWDTVYPPQQYQISPRMSAGGDAMSVADKVAASLG